MTENKKEIEGPDASANAFFDFTFLSRPHDTKRSEMVLVIFLCREKFIAFPLFLAEK